MIRLFEFEDLSWVPKSLRDAGTDYLRFQWESSKAYKPIVQRLGDLMARTGHQEILDLGAGGGGPVLKIYEDLVKSGRRARIILTDKFPNLDAFVDIRRRTGGDVDFLEKAVDATSVPAYLEGIRTLFATVHHFRPATVQRILQDAVVHRRPVGIFDFSAFPSPPPPLVVLLGTPLGVLLASPFVRPFRWSRIFWTYIIPVLPFLIAWDGQVSALRLYSARKLREIVEGLPPNDYVWKIGKDQFPHALTYLVGYPGLE